MAKSNNKNRLPIIFLMGPTASGKTALAVELVQKLPLEIISVDSAMVYRGMDIGTAKPSPEILNIAPHRLIDICDPAESYSAGNFCRDAYRVIDEIHAQDKIPLLVGGTGLYFRSLEQGFSSLPQANPGVRDKLEAEARDLGWDKMHQRLENIDPVAAARIHRNDPQRIQRALEVYELTGRPLSELHSQGRQASLDYPLIKLIVAAADRTNLHKDIETRFVKMLNDGLVDEVKALYKRGDLSPALPAMRLVGYRQVWDYLEGRESYKNMIEKGIIATRQLAKRQMTWFRSEQNADWFDAGDVKLSHCLHDLLRDNVIP